MKDKEEELKKEIIQVDFICPVCNEETNVDIFAGVDCYVESSCCNVLLYRKDEKFFRAVNFPKMTPEKTYEEILETLKKYYDKNETELFKD